MKARPAASGLPRPIRIGISACLLGQRVRYDGGHKDQPWTRSLGGRIEWVPVCPEVELGLGTPREPIQLVALNSSSPRTLRRPRASGDPGPSLDSRLRGNDGMGTGTGPPSSSPSRRGPSPSPRLVGVESGRDLTRRMRAYAAARLRELAALGLCGYVFKDRSPSCGLGDVPVAAPGGDAAASGTGLFAKAFRTRFPRLPVAGEDRLRDPARREAFLMEVLAYAARRPRHPLTPPSPPRGEGENTSPLPAASVGAPLIPSPPARGRGQRRGG